MRNTNRILFIKATKPLKLMAKLVRQARTLNRQDLVKPTEARAKRRVTPLVIGYNPNLPNVGRILRDNLHILYSTKLMRDIFPDKSIIPAVRRPKNLKEMPAPSKLKVQESSKNND